MKLTSQRGDTIVEVLIAMVIVSSVLAGAFASANRSLNTTVAARDRDQGVRLAESQLEQLKTVVKNPATQATASGFNTFCIRQNIPIPTAAPITSDLASDAFNGSVYPSGCTLDSGNGDYAVGDLSIPYYVSISRDSTDSNLYVARVRWERAGGGGRDQVELQYRVFP